MNAGLMQQLAHLIQAQPIGALGTLHQGRPFVSMVPYAVLPNATALVMHVSQLANHTRDMLENPAVSLLIMAQSDPAIPPQALARVTIEGEARVCDILSPDYDEAKSTYLDRFPQSADLFGFSDFRLFLIRPNTARFIGGYARATSLTAATLAEAVRSRA